MRLNGRLCLFLGASKRKRKKELSSRCSTVVMELTASIFNTPPSNLPQLLSRLSIFLDTEIQYLHPHMHPECVCVYV